METLVDGALACELQTLHTWHADMNKRPQTMLKPLLVVNMDVKDNAEEASLAAPQALKLCSMVRHVHGCYRMMNVVWPSLMSL